MVAPTEQLGMACRIIGKHLVLGFAGTAQKTHIEGLLANINADPDCFRCLCRCIHRVLAPQPCAYGMSRKRTLPRYCPSLGTQPAWALASNRDGASQGG